MIQARTTIAPRLDVPRTETLLHMNWAAHLLLILGVFEEYQSSAIGVTHLRAAMRCEPSLAAVLRPSLAEMWHAHRSLRREIRGMLDDFAGVIADTRIDPAQISYQADGAPTLGHDTRPELHLHRRPASSPLRSTAKRGVTATGRDSP